MTSGDVVDLEALGDAEWEAYMRAHTAGVIEGFHQRRRAEAVRHLAEDWAENGFPMRCEPYGHMSRYKPNDGAWPNMPECPGCLLIKSGAQPIASGVYE